MRRHTVCNACRILFIALLILSVSYSATRAAELVNFNSHQIHIILDIPSQKATISDAGQLELTKGKNIIVVAENAENLFLSIDGKSVVYRPMSLKRVNVSNDSAVIMDALGERFSSRVDDANPTLLIFNANETTTANFIIGYSAIFNQDVSQTRFSRENVGGEIKGTIGEKGAYLSPSSYYYPSGKEDGAYFGLSVSLPEGWEAVSDGNRISSAVVEGRKQVTYQNPFVSDGNMFMAAPYVVGIDSIDNIEVACFFFAEDSALIPDYLESTIGYIRMYSDLIGPYPYTRFTVAENFFPTGYGMPAWTLLGQQVIRLPFIKATSLGHEVLHNWWGNSVYVDYDRGNWCESATVYGADYRYKLLQSPEAAKAYRKNILKEYVSYVREANDFPIREFKGRTSANTRTIGYNKAMMVWHMLEEEIGSESFWAAWRLINERYITKRISWEEWIATLEETSGLDLSHIIPQWIDRAGAPEIAFKITGGGYSGEEKEGERPDLMRIVIKQKSELPYRLSVPVRYKDRAGVHDTVLVLNDAAAEYLLPDNRITSIEIDPDYHLFRKLYPEEVEPIVSGVLGMPEHLLVCDSGDPEMRQAFQEFGNNLVGDSLSLNKSESQATATAETAPIVINPATMPDEYYDLYEITSDSIRVLDIWYPTEGHTFVLSGKSWMNAEKYMIVLTADPASLPRLGQLVPHYGKYSYLIFEGSRNVGKGQWPAPNSPLKRGIVYLDY